jgi:hypothetical protein
MFSFLKDSLLLKSFTPSISIVAIWEYIFVILSKNVELALLTESA